MNRRILLLTLTTGILLGIIGGVFAGTMVGAGVGLLSHAFSNADLATTMNALLAKGIIRPEGDGVAVDEEALGREVPRARTRGQVKGLLAFVRLQPDGKLALDSRAVEVRYRALPAGAERGPIWDRDGQVLAQSIRDLKTERGRREYPLGAAAFHVVGASHPAFGDRGIEAAYQQELIQGYGVTLTLSAPLQRTAAEALGNRPGAAVVMAVPSGEVLALASAPSFDPGERKAEPWLTAERDRDGRPFTNRAFSALYPPGSAFKVVTLAAWLEAPGFNPHLAVECGLDRNPYRIRDQHVRGRVELRAAFARSCNAFFAEVGVRLGPRLMDRAEQFGFNEPLPVLPEGRKGFAAAASRAFTWLEGEGEQAYRDTDFRRNPKVVAQSAIGQNLVVATPLQMVLVAAMVAADGRRMDPLLVRSVGTAPDRGEHSALGVGMFRPETAQMIARLMEAVMTDGTASRLPHLYRGPDGVRVARSRPWPDAVRLAVAGKTGTAEVPNGRPHAWFIGFAPAHRPEVAVAVVIEHGGAGADVAGPVAVDLLAASLNVVWRTRESMKAAAPATEPR